MKVSKACFLSPGNIVALCNARKLFHIAIKLTEKGKYNRRTCIMYAMKLQIYFTYLMKIEGHES